MKEITMYECEICNALYREYKDAIACENRGKETPLVNVGDEVSFEIKVGGGFDSIFGELRVREIEDTGHYFIYRFNQEHMDEGWEESSYSIYGNDEFEERCTVVKTSSRRT